MKKIIALLLAVFMTVSMASCSSNTTTTSSSTSASSAVSTTVSQITVWTMYSEDQDATKPYGRLQKWASEFNASHSNIQVVVEGGKTKDVILTAISSGETPDIFQNYWQNAPSYAAAGSIVDLTDFVNSDTAWNKDDFLTSCWGLCTYDGNVYSLPFTASTTYILYNPEILAECGWKAFPNTMDELLQCAEDCTVMDSSGNLTRVGLNPIFPWEDDVLWPVAYGAEWQDNDGNVTFNNETMGKAYSFEKTLIDAMGGYTKVNAWTSNYKSTRSTTDDPLLTGKCAMYFASDSNLAALEAAAEKLGKTLGTDFKIATLPNQMLTCGVWEMNANTTDSNTAWTVLSSMTSAENMAYMAYGDSNNGAFTPRKSSLKALESYDVSDAVKQAASLLMTSNLEHFPMSAYVSEYLSSIGTNMGEYLSGSVSLDAAMQAVQKEATEAKKSYE